MPERCSGLTLNSPPPFCIIVFMEQLMTLRIDHGDRDLTVRYLASLKSKLADEKAARKEAKNEVQTLARACVDLKKMEINSTPKSLN
jgi:hypothetical protein